MNSPKVQVGRLPVLASALGKTFSSFSPKTLTELVNPTRLDQIWLAFAVLSARLPDAETLIEAARAEQLDPGTLWDTIASHRTNESDQRTVRVVDETLVDVTYTAQVPRMSGIQRVAREVASRWMQSPGVELIAWTSDGAAMRRLSPAERYWVTHASTAPDSVSSQQPTEVLVPWRTRVLLPEVALDPPERVARMRTMAQHSGVKLGAIGFDLIPLTSAEFAAPQIPGLFSVGLTVLREASTVATISQAAAIEYEGWRSALSALGRPGPSIEAISLPVEASEVSASELESARERLTIAGLPLILVVGSHEPRKNHITVLRAAELLWRKGHRFALTFIGAPGWNNTDFEHLYESLVASGRPLDTITEASEALLWAAYRLARFTVFPSLNEGFGLPVAESLAVGTPAITSNFGSMAEIAAGGGALTIDPRDTFALIDAMRLLLDDDALLASLRADALARPLRTWDDYASEVWVELTSDKSPMMSTPQSNATNQ